MTVQRLAELALECRVAQKRYFREKGHEALVAAKQAECQLDAVVQEILHPEAVEASLFGREE